MAQRKARCVAAVGGLLVMGAGLAGCAEGPGSHLTAGGVGSTTSSVTATATAPVPATTVPATAIPAPSTTVAAPSASPSTVTGGAVQTGPTLIVRSFDSTVGYAGREPSTIGFSRDSTNIVSHLTWRSWGPDTAVGQGLLGVNGCEPSCAVGTVTQVLTTINLSKVVGGHFTAMTEKAGSLLHSYSYPADWAVSAS